MSVSRLFFPCSEPFPSNRGPAGLVIRRAEPDTESDSIARLTEIAQIGAIPSIQGPGLVAELVSRPGRQVEAWLALLDDVPLGLVALVAATAGPRVRHSVAWLLVSPRARRRGIATALVARALDAARDRGATDVWVETRSDWVAATAFWRSIGFRAPG